MPTTLPAPADEDLLALDAPTLERELATGRLTAERLTRASLARIAALDDRGPALHAIIEINPDAIEIARDLDRELAANGPVGPLHGLPVVLKANIDTADRMATSAGSLALAGHRAAADAEIVAKLRAAGAVILAKANMSEWANFRSTHSTSGWSSLGGQTRNPYVLDRSPCGSSSGSAVAVAAGFAPLAVGTETDGSIVCPAGMNGVVGIKPTHGLVSGRGIVPIASSQDTAGPLARTVAGAAMLLAAMEADDARAADVPAGEGAAGEGAAGEWSAGDAGLRGVRLGVVRDYRGAGRHPDVEAAFAAWLDMLADAGAELVDPIELDLPPDFASAELDVLLHEFKIDLDAYLAAERVEPGSLEALIEFNRAHASAVMPYFGQELFVAAASRSGAGAAGSAGSQTGTAGAASREGFEDDGYRRAREASQHYLRAKLASLFAGHALDALVAPVNEPAPEIDLTIGDRMSLSSSTIAAASGYPSIAVPGGLVGELPVGLAFVGKPYTEALLIAIAADFERLRGPVPAPRFLPKTARRAFRRRLRRLRRFRRRFRRQ